jgi:pimeloyl-ACP methyl ester carboxylesterase
MMEKMEAREMRLHHGDRLMTIRNIVLVHGGFVDGSGWEGVDTLLTRSGYNVAVVQNATLTLAGDVATTNQVLDEQDGDVVLVGHSYGGVVITEAGNHPKVTRLVYITAFAADAGESVLKLVSNPPPGAPTAPILPPQDGFLFLDKEKFADSFAGDVAPGKASFMARSQVPWGLEAANGVVATPAWRSKPSFYLVATDDKMIPVPAQRMMAERAGATVRKASGSHAIYVSKPEAVVDIIEAAANS